jgi:hypothetical protein
VSEVTVARWRKYGKDRLYVTAPDGTRLGWRDLISGEEHLESASGAERLKLAADSWLREQSSGAAAAADSRAGSKVPLGTDLPPQQAADLGNTPVVSMPIQEPVAGSVPTKHAWEDLAAHRAGAMARQQAVALKEAAPVRTLLTRVLGVHTDERAWRTGADGEEKVAAQLAKLAKKDSRWRFLHAAKHHPNAKIWVGGNTVLVNGSRQPYVRNSRHDATRGADLLTDACGFPVIVTGVIVPVGADDLTVKSQPDDVYVISRMAIAGWIRARRPVLDEETTSRIFDAARRSTTWR